MAIGCVRTANNDFMFCSVELSTRYEFTQESSSSAKQEVDQLREEVKVMSAQLLRQHNASLDSQVRCSLLCEILKINKHSLTSRQRMFYLFSFCLLREKLFPLSQPVRNTTDTNCDFLIYISSLHFHSS